MSFFTIALVSGESLKDSSTGLLTTVARLKAFWYGSILISDLVYTPGDFFVCLMVGYWSRFTGTVARIYRIHRQ